MLTIKFDLDPAPNIMDTIKVDKYKITNKYVYFLICYNAYS